MNSNSKEVSSLPILLSPLTHDLARFGGSTPFEIFDAYKEVGLKYFDRRDDSAPTFNETLYGILHDEEYCLKTDLYNLQHQDDIFEQMTIFTDFPQASIFLSYLLSFIHSKALPAEAMKIDDISVLEDVSFGMGLSASLLVNILLSHLIFTSRF